MYLMYIIAMISCIKKGPVQTVADARNYFNESDNCAETFKEVIKKYGDCEQAKYTYLNEFEVIFQCHKDKRDRKSLWDTAIYRAGPWQINHETFEEAQNNPRMLCLDDYTIIEIYRPKELGNKTGFEQ